jgi:hypothetical protein
MGTMNQYRGEMVDVSQIGWGRYKAHEGPYFRGTIRFSLGRTYSDSERTMAVVTAAEGGCYDAVNMYDRCILSSGLCQACEAGNYFTSDLLGAVYRAAPAALDPVMEAAAGMGASFRLNGKGRYRFFFEDPRGEIDRTEEQRQLFLGESSGEIGSWDDGSKALAKSWAAAVATTLSHPDSRFPQVEFWAPRLRSFLTKPAQEYMFGEYPIQAGGGDWSGAAKAAMVSYAINLPSVASDHVMRFARATRLKKGSPDWVRDLLRKVTFDPGVTIWPDRYAAIRPVLEKLYGVDLPDMSQDLEDFVARSEEDGRSSGILAELDTTVKVQGALVKAGYDIGPSGADGRMGPKTRGAVMEFQRSVGLPDTGVMDMATATALFHVAM